MGLVLVLVLTLALTLIVRRQNASRVFDQPALAPVESGTRVAIVLGAGLVAIAVLDLRGKGWTRTLFRYSIVYLGALFALFALSPFVD